MRGAVGLSDSGGGGGIQINQDVFLNHTDDTVTVDGQVFLRSGYVSSDLATYPDATASPLSIDSATYDSVSPFTSEVRLTGLAFSSDGTKMFAIGYNSDRVELYNLSTAWDLSTAGSIAASFSVSGQDSSPQSVEFSTDGTKMYILGGTNDRVYQYTLSTAWDLTTASYASKSYYVNSQEASPRGLAFSSDGTKMYVVGNSNDTVYQYALSTAWDVSTASYGSVSFSVSTYDTVPTGLAFSADGTRMYVTGDTNNSVFQFSLSTAWDVSTASYDNRSLDVSAQSDEPQGLALSADGTKLYLIDQNDAKVYQYSIATVVGLQTEHSRGDATQYVRVK